MEKLAIVGTFYDGYYSIWEDFLELFSIYWPDCPYRLYIVNDSKELDFDKKYNVTIFHAGENAEYSQRVQTALEKIDAEYYLLLLEDFFIGEKVVNDPLSPILSFIIKNGLKYYRMPLREFTPFNKKNKIEPITPQMEYTVSCQPSIWKKDFLSQCIGTEKYNAWIFEGVYSKAPAAHSEQFLKGCYIDYRNPLNIYHGALQSKLLNKTVEHFTNKGYKFKSKLPLISKCAERKHTIKKIFKLLCPNSVQKLIKKNISTTSVVERYDKDIDQLIIKMGLD